MRCFLNPTYSVIVPVYNEEAVLEECYRRLAEVFSGLQSSWEILFVNDGSSDGSGEMIRALASRDPHIQFIEFARNFGHQTAITAGYHNARGEAIIVLDADLQDPPELIPEMIAKWKEGFEVVYAKREKREGETIFKKMTSSLYYRILRALTSVSIPVDVGDFRLVDRKVCEAFKTLKERNLFVRGLISWLGFRQTEVLFVRAPRAAGITKYPLRKMIRLAMDGLFAFSAKPLKLAMGPGFLMAIAGFLYFIYVLYLKFFTDNTELGWPSIMSAILFFNGYTLIMIGVLGEYLGRLFEESKGRPLYVTREVFLQEVPEQ